MRVLQWRKLSLVKLLAVLAAALISWYFIKWIAADIFSEDCTDRSSKHMLNSLCQLWRKNGVGGNLCEDICQSHSIKYTSCLNVKSGKKVFNATWNTKPIILISKHGYFEDYVPVDVVQDTGAKSGDNKEKTEDNYPSFEEFARRIQERIRVQLGIKGSRGQLHLKRIFDNFWSIPFDDYFTNSNQKNAKVAGLESINSLMQQDEYVMLKQVQRTKYFPKVHGTCGHFYAIENVPRSGFLLRKNINWGDPYSWNQRRLLAIKMLDFIHYFEHSFHEPLHLCDVNSKNFGITENGQIKTVDLDMAFFDKHLKQFLSTQQCTKHIDCNFFDCKGWCDLRTNRCTDRRINNNLQVFCSKIFSPHVANGNKGLLQNPPAKLKTMFEKLLDECGNPWNIQDEDIRLKTPDGTHWKLHRLLQQSSPEYFPRETPPQHGRHDQEH